MEAVSAPSPRSSTGSPAPTRTATGWTARPAAERTIDQIEKQVGASFVAAVIIEPVQGEGGFIVPAPGFLTALRRWCLDNGVVFIADEIQSGIARTGAWFACEHEGVVPDLVTTAKGLAGGTPLSAVTGSAEIMDSAGPGALGGTYCGNPLACAAALATTGHDRGSTTSLNGPARLVRPASA